MFMLIAALLLHKRFQSRMHRLHWPCFFYTYISRMHRLHWSCFFYTCIDNRPEPCIYGVFTIRLVGEFPYTWYYTGNTTQFYTVLVDPTQTHTHCWSWTKTGNWIYKLPSCLKAHVLPAARPCSPPSPWVGNHEIKFRGMWSRLVKQSSRISRPTVPAVRAEDQQIKSLTFRIGQNHTFIGIYGVYMYIRYFWQGNHHTVPKLYQPARIMILRGAAKCGQKINK